MSLDRETVARIARLARIDVADDELDRLGNELGNILDWVEELNAVPTDGVAPMVGVTVARAPLRKDVVTEGGRQADVLANAPDAEPPYFAVPKVIE